MARALAYAVLVGLVGAALVHIVILLLLPGMSEKDAWTRLSAAAGLNLFTPYSDSVGDDPLFRRIACRFDLEDGPVHVLSQGTVPFWSASVYDRAGNNVYSLSDRNAANRALDLVVLSPSQMLALRKDLPEEDEASTFVEVPAEEGIIALRVFMPDASWKPAVDSWLAAATCRAQPS